MEGLTTNLIICVIAVCFGTQFQFYNNCVGSNMQETMKEWFNGSMVAHYGVEVTDSTFSYIFSATTAAQQLGAVVSAFAMKPVAEKFGRRKTLLVTGLIEALGTLISALSKLANSLEMFAVGRFVLGLGFGMGTGVTAMLISELAPAKIRGAIGTCMQIFLGLGITIAYGISIDTALGSHDLWPVAIVIPAIPALIQSIIMSQVHDPPKYLLFTKNNREASLASFAFYRGRSKAEQALRDLEIERVKSRINTRVSLREVLTEKVYRWPLILSFMSMFAIQWTGSGPVMSYAKNIFLAAGLKDDIPDYATVGLGALNLVCPFLVLFVIDKAGRRVLFISGLSIAWVTIVALAVLMAFPLCERCETAAIPVVYIYQIGYSFASTVGWILPSELFPQNTRSYGVTVQVISYWFWQMVTLLCYLPYTQAVHPHDWADMVPFIIVTFFCILFFYFFQPETKGVSPETRLHAAAQNGSPPVFNVAAENGDSPVTVVQVQVQVHQAYQPHPKDIFKSDDCKREKF